MKLLIEDKDALIQILQKDKQTLKTERDAIERLAMALKTDFEEADNTVPDKEKLKELRKTNQDLTIELKSANLKIQSLTSESGELTKRCVCPIVLFQTSPISIYTMVLFQKSIDLTYSLISMIGAD